MQTNLNDLRDILYNLIKLSFDQEELMNEFRTVDQTDPKFVELGQWQLNLKDDAKIVEDSLLSLAKRAGQLGSFVTREVSDMNTYMDNSIQAIRDRKKAKATSEQQFSMTTMNNLALMLDDVMEMMQKNLSEAMGNPNNQGQQPTPSLSELQKQLNQQIEQLKRSGKSGRDLSEELAKLAAEQERIRKAMQEMESQLEGGEGENRNNIAEKMEETEIDLVNKQITAETIKRQKEILTRLLEAENAMRERELDNEREGETANSYENQLPKAFEEYFKAKEKEIELLKTVPPKLYPYYKKEVNEYFKRIGNQKFE
jgi:chromosome segregation ATPase